MQRALRREKQIVIGRDQTARLMRELGLQGVRRGAFKRTTTPDQTAPRPADLVDRNFHADRPDQLWIVDLTYIRTWVGFAYLALVIDVFARRIVGWALATHMRTDLPLEALEMAIWTRQRAGIQNLTGLIHHGDSETVPAGVLRVPDPHSDGHDRMLVPGAPRASDPHSDRSVVFPRICRCPGSDL